MGSPVLGAARLTVYLLVTALLVPLQALAVWLRWPLRRSLPRVYHALCTRILGFRLVVIGERSRERPTLFISNHSSYLDIEVLSSVIPGSFVAKTEVAAWPFFGVLAKLQETVFVARQARGQVGRQRDEMRDRLMGGDNLILFPEGTSSDGNRLLPFKTALFAAAAMRIGERPLVVQPVTVTATALDGIPLGRALRPLYAWYGDMELVPHLWALVKLTGITVVVEFHRPVTAEQFRSRKGLADHCWQVMAAGISRALSGRLEPKAPPEPAAASADPAVELVEAMPGSPG
ncbi:MAG: 1-acyl-sn-glycerol-3-phosphate acyltransferase [Azospirillum sp.]|nr:1-acyl-sn-glycerol-3-phosphate acyltransferase [Azospirillum sp.]